MLAQGEWRPENPEADPKIRSYHLSSLYSPVGWYSWADAARDFTRAKSTPEKLRAFVNTVLGQTWKEKGEAPEWEKLYRRREAYEIGTVPPGVVFLTAGADIQKDRIEVEVVGWGYGKESWSIAYYVLPGDTSSPDNPVWSELARLLEKQFPDQNKAMHPIRMTAVDSGYNTQTVYNFVRRQNQARVIATKGQDSLPTAVGIPKAVDVSIKGKQIKRGLKLWSVGVSMLKSELYSLLNLEAPLKASDNFPPGFCHFPEYPEDFFKMLTAEQLVVRYSKGFRKYEWEKLRERNEALDCRVLARASAAVFGIDRFTPAQWDDLDAFGNAKRESEVKAAETEGEGEQTQSDIAASAPAQGTARTEPEAKPPTRRRSTFW
jgi:phage terminase large subunit GpA-like protein